MTAAVRKFSGDELVIATHNKNKVEEFRHLFGDRIKTLYMAKDFGLDSPPETESTYIGNATIKALHAARATGKIVLADDSGMSVTALDGAPGVYSADWAEQPDGSRDWKFAMNKVNSLVGDDPDKRARFVSCLVLAWPDGHIESVEGYLPGQIVWPPRGGGVFGYDPMFQPDGCTETFAEMQLEKKNGMSHRAIAFRLMMDKCFS